MTLNKPLFFSFLIGAFIVDCVATLQFFMIFGYFQIEFYFIPTIVGGVSGILLSRQQQKNIDYKKFLEEKSTRLELVLGGTGLGLWDWNPSTNEVVFDERWANMLGYKLTEIEPSLDSWQSRVHPDDIEACFKDIKNHISGNSEYYNNIHRMMHKDGKWRYILDRGRVAERDGNGQPIRFTGAHTDVTELKEIEVKLKQQNDNLDKEVLRRTQSLEKQTDLANKANKAKSDFLSNMSHELRTPMHGILSYANMGINKFDTASDEKKLKYFANIKISGDRLMVLLNNLLDITRLESGKMEILFKPNNLKGIVESCVAEQQSRLESLNLGIVYQSGNIEGNGIYDGVQLGQVITNFLSNAIKFSLLDSSIEITIKKTCLYDNTKDDALLFSLKDNGKGIKKEELEIIFNEFEQGSDSELGTTKGTGLGLSISKKIIQCHNGKIWAENHADGGAVFSFIIPVEQPDIDVKEEAS